MEVKTLTKKKTTINKGKIKKTIKNVLCRPDPVFWPVVSVNDVYKLESALSKYKVTIPDFKKPHWKEIKDIPKEKRTKPPAIEKVDGLVFGISECSSSLQKGECSAVILDSGVNPQTIVQPTVEACIASDLPIVCMNTLRKISLEYFGLTTSCLGIKNDCLLELRNEILEVAKNYRPPLRIKGKLLVESMDVDCTNTKKLPNESIIKENNTSIVCPFLYRTNKRTRVFVPAEGVASKVTKPFIGQDFIDISNSVKPKDKNNTYMNMILKRVTNNPNRVKRK